MKANDYTTKKFYLLMMVTAFLWATNVQPAKAATIIEQTSELYVFSIENLAFPDGHCDYIYSPSVRFSQGFLNYLDAEYPAIQNFIPSVANELVRAYFLAESTNLPVGEFYGGVNNLDAFTIDYWDDIVNVLLNPDIGMGACSDCEIAGQNISITSADGLVLYADGRRYEDRIVEFYEQNKQTYTNESNYTSISYEYVDGRLVMVTREIIERENMDVYNLAVKFNAGTETGIKTGEKTAFFATPVAGGLLIKGLVPGDRFEVYDISGQIVYSSKASNTEEFVKLNIKGVYIIKAGKELVKAIIHNS